MDYKDTLNLPKTDFPMKANLTKREPEMLARWEGMRIYDRIRADAKGRKPYILHDGPPYANGNIHLGTALNKIIKDILIKAKNMDGPRQRLRPRLGLSRPPHRTPGGQGVGREEGGDVPGGQTPLLPGLCRSIRGDPAGAVQTPRGIRGVGQSLSHDDL